MAYNFVSASSQSLSVASAPVTTTPFTIACWAKWASAGANQALMSLGSSSADERHLLYLSGAGNANMFSGNGGTFGQAAFFGVPTGTWMHVCGVVSSTASRQIYIDGVAGTADTTAVSAITPTHTYIGAYYTNGSVVSGFYHQGEIAEVGIWDVALTAQEIASLARAVSPSRVRPGNLQFYAPIIRALHDQVGGLILTNNNSATVATHPRVIRPRPRTYFIPAAAPGGGFQAAWARNANTVIQAVA